MLSCWRGKKIKEKQKHRIKKIREFIDEKIVDKKPKRNKWSEIAAMGFKTKYQKDEGAGWLASTSSQRRPCCKETHPSSGDVPWGSEWVDFTLDPPLQMTVRPSINAANFRVHKRFAVAGWRCSYYLPLQFDARFHSNLIPKQESVTWVQKTNIKTALSCGTFLPALTTNHLIRQRKSWNIWLA